ncbi:hypothetical protein V8E54_008555 [Elaphomyces granulatus]
MPHSQIQKKTYSSEHDNSEIKRDVLRHTELKYERALRIYDQLISQAMIHPRATDPPDIKSYKAFMGFYGKNTPGRLDERPTVGAVEDFRGDFEVGMARRRKYHFPNMSPLPLEEARVQLSAAMLLYSFSSARAGEVNESTARRALAREQKTNDKELEAQHFRLTIDWQSREYIKGYWRKQQWELPVHAFYDIYAKDIPLFSQWHRLMAYSVITLHSLRYWT